MLNSPLLLLEYKCYEFTLKAVAQTIERSCIMRALHNVQTVAIIYRSWYKTTNIRQIYHPTL